MIGMVAKLLPIALLAGGVYKGKDKIKDIANYPVKMGTQMELTNIARILRLDSIDESWPYPDEFSEYLRSSMKKKKGRDMANDLWGNKYILIDKDQELIVVSGGPDGQIETRDDMKITVQKY